MVEKRAARRYRVLKGATISFDGSGIPCTVRNLSSGGAAIDLDERTDPPPSFMLTIESDRLIRRCRPARSSERRVGVAFI